MTISTETPAPADAQSNAPTDAPAGFAKDQLQSFIERYERLEEEKTNISEDMKLVLQEAKCSGFDIKALRTILKLRKEDPDARQEHDAIVELYAAAIGITL
ncbi:DUF2312 domain-containing protein [Xanthobacter sp. TB0139]|uniref:DUF2312 domain-containing protein n=1 Tax=Xanthobacter sp. TB0139 TaxID=3459178 RepID=UPI0040396F1A